MKTMNILNKVRKMANQFLPFCLFALLPLTGSLLTSCENDGFYYQDEARVRLVGEDIWAVGSDSITFSFVTYPSETTTMDISVDACIMGEVADYARTANLTVDASKTTASSSQYEMPTSVTIPAGENKATFTVTLKRDASLQSTTVRLYLKVAESNDFLVGDNEGNHVIFIWNDVLSKPNNWSELEEFFGTYSNVKYRFMLNNAGGISGFSTDTMTWAELMSYRIKFANALNEYNAAHPGNPLTDENGQLVTF